MERRNIRYTLVVWTVIFFITRPLSRSRGERERGPGEKSRVTSPESYNVWPPPVPTVATINLTIVKGRLIHATLLPDRYSPTPPNSPILSTFASNKLSPDSFFDHFFFFLLLLLLLFILFLFNFTF